MTAHNITVSIVGAGTGSTHYIATCSCRWRHEDYSPMALHDRVEMHQKQASR